MQDRRRPLWPVAVMVAPLIVGMVWCIVSRSDALIPTLFGYLLLMSIGLIIYMVREVKRYGRWLRDNYADLEHKEVWQTFVVLAVILLVFCFYAFSGKGLCYEYLLQLIVVVLIGYLLWRVETLSDLSLSQPLPSPVEEETITTQTTYEYIAPLLQQHCIETQLYLQHDLTLPQLAQAVGTNRFYLSQYFSAQGTNYNAYINNLRINHFVSLYHEAVDSNRSITPQQLAQECGYRSYNTFRNALKQKTGQSVTAWLKTLNEGSGVRGKMKETS
jgi:AraC-like DNA-binding protein